MFGHHVQCPVEAADRERVEESYVRLVERFGVSLLSGTVVLPTSEYFPGPFVGASDQMQALVDGVAAAMGMTEGDHVAAVPLVRSGATAQRGLTGCAGYPGGAFRSGEGESVLAIDQALAGRPIALVATIAHMLGHLRFVGQVGIPAQRTAREHFIELHAVCTGFGIFSANAAVEVQVDPRANRVAAATYGLSQRRPTFHHSGYLTQELHGYALACLAFIRGEPHPRWMKHLDTNLRAYMRQSLRYLTQYPPEQLVTIQAGIVASTAPQTPEVS
ncbi:hypothetical protein KDL01_09190 [Actinospica durhamensis]|uniref:Uncharacterized protein n=1 Tax=Actinospica durhamensis TaxID=1508375 RepID=A0A941EQU4_9ACTN|nr:hypothetical protein [Actinospica durhamensis]MBR7833439.1 hypothetical protein [Actinospica durhamensis]